MPDSEIGRQVTSPDAMAFWADPLMWSCVAMVVLGHLARVFKTPGPVDWRALFAELLMAAIGAVGIYAGAELQGMGVLEKILTSVLMSLGGIHVVQRALQAWSTIKGAG